MRLVDLEDMTINQILDHINNLEGEIEDLEKSSEKLGETIDDLEKEVAKLSEES